MGVPNMPSRAEPCEEMMFDLERFGLITQENEYHLFVWIVSAMTVTKVVEGCVYIRRRYYAIFGILSGGEFKVSALCSASLSPLCPLIQRL